MTLSKTLLALLGIGALTTEVLGAKSPVDIPVSSCANVAYLSDMDGRIWWNKAWRKRAAVLVSNMAKVRTPRTTIDFVFDVGESVDLASVRVVTPYEVEIPCVCEPIASSAASPTALRILFQTDLREMENRPFFVYWDNPAAKPAKVRSSISLDVSANEVYVNNGCLEAVFDNLHRTSGFLRSLKANASPTPNALLSRTTGYAWEGFSFEPEVAKAQKKADSHQNPLDAQIHKADVPADWSKATVTVDNAIRKTITFTNATAAVDFTFYQGEPRVDYAYRLAPGVRNVTIGVAWACGGGVAHDDFFYPGLAGNVLTQRAALDWVSDSERAPMEYYRFPWFGKGWYAISDRKTRDVVGIVFDRESFVGPSYLAGASHCGETARLQFRHVAQAGSSASGSGALVAAVGDHRLVESAYEILRNRPRVFVGAVQPYREIAVGRRDLAHDWCVNYNVGGWRSSKPLPGDDWAENIMTHLRERGANTILLGQLTDYVWTELPVPKELYDRVCAYMAKVDPSWKAPPWDGTRFKGDRLREICAAAHAKGMAVCTWHAGLPGIKGVFFRRPFDPEFWELVYEIQALYPKCGVDSVFCTPGGGEGQPLPDDVVKKFGYEYWKWADPKPYFDSRHEIGSRLKAFCDRSHRENPNARVMVFNSDSNELRRDGCMPYYPEAMDTLFCEFVERSGDITKIKHVAKRLRGYFDNQPGHTIHAHYYSMKLDHVNRIFENELHFICGVNGFSNEAMSYEHTESENSQFQADFYRLAEHTRLGEKVARMAPVKNLAVLRDIRSFEEDIIRRRLLKYGWGYPVSRHDRRVHAFASIPSYNYDIVMNHYFRHDSLKRYPAVYLPDDEVLSDDLVAELLKYVEAGGGAVLEGASGQVLDRIGVSREPGKPTAYGRGKFVWTPEILTDRLIAADASAGEAVKALVASVGGQNPLEISNPELDGVLQSSAGGLFLGVYNKETAPEKGRVSVNLATRQPFGDPDSLYVLDVRTGERFPYTDGFEIAIGPQQCGFYLIGDAAFTALPRVKEADWCGASTMSVSPAGVLPDAPDLSFEPAHCVEFVTPGPRNYAGLPAEIQRSAVAMLERHRFCASEKQMAAKAKTNDLAAWMAEVALGARHYSPVDVAQAIAKSNYVHLQCESEDCDAMFEDCAGELKDLLKRGGGILFSRTPPGPKARKFLAEIGVFDPWPSLKDGYQEPAVWAANVSTNHLFCSFGGEKTLFNKGIGAGQKFTRWDTARQYAPYVDKLDSTAALMVIQENVLGAGKVIFSNNRYCFTSWYENRNHGDALLSFLLGQSVREHAEKVIRRNGGPGTLVR